jgi:hypothetical protein
MSNLASLSPNAASAAILPEWAVIFAFVASLVLTILKIWEVAKVGRVELRLTRDMLMRVLTDGEMFFVDAVFLAKRGDVLIREVSFRLFKHGQVKKEVPLVVRWVGEKVHATGKPFSDFHFISSSMLEFVPENTPKRALYMANVSDYAPKIQQEFSYFTKQCERWAAEGSASESGILGLSVERQREISDEIEKLIASSAGAIAKHVQLEAGHYSLEMAVKYEPTIWWLPSRTSEVKSSIDFEMGPEISQIQMRIAENLRQQTRGICFNSKELYMWPEFAPKAASERA